MQRNSNNNNTSSSAMHRQQQNIYQILKLNVYSDCYEIKYERVNLSFEKKNV